MNSPNREVETRIACGHAIGSCIITWDGYVTGCVYDGDCKFGFGNVKNESIKSIWNKRNEQLVRLHVEHRWDELNDACRNCNSWKHIGEMRVDENGQPVVRNYSPNGAIYDSLPEAETHDAEFSMECSD